MNDKIRKIAIVWANPYNKNLGVGALAYSSLALVSDICKANNIKAEFTFLGSSKATADTLYIGDQKIKFDNILGIDFSSWRSYVKMLLKPKKYETKKLLTFDLVLDMGEGDSFADIYGEKRFNRIYSSKAFFNLINTPQVLLPQTIGPFSQSDNKKKAISIMKKLELILSRDKKSYDYTSEFLKRSKIEELVDIAFYLPFTKGINRTQKINVGINVSGLLWNGGYTGKNQFNMKADYRSTVTKVLDFFSENKDVQIHIISHVIPEHQPVENDHVVALELKEKYPEVIVSPIFENPIEAKSYISGMDFFTGARMHACIAAFSSGVAVVPMAYSRKFNGLFGDTLDYPFIADCVNNSEEEVFDMIATSYIQRKELDKRVNISLETIVRPRLNLLRGVLFKVISGQ